MIYAITDGEYVKFGKASDPIQRLNSLQIGNAKELRLVACAEWPDAEEPLIHLYLEHCWCRGEWFRREADAEKVIGMLRDAKGLDDWKRLSRTGNNRPRTLRIAARRAEWQA
jgi:hypothetical protein